MWLGTAMTYGIRLIAARGGFLAILVLAGVPALAQLASPPDGAERKVLLPSAPRGWSVPSMSAGFLVRWRVDTFASDRDSNFAVYDREGKTVLQQRIWFPDAARVQIHDAVVSAHGMVALVGTAYGSTGAVAHFWATMPLNGGAAAVFQVSPFGGLNIAFGPDNTVWILGMEVGPGGRMMAAAPHATLRHYRLDGSLLDQHLPWPEMQCGRHPVDLASGLPFVVSSRDRIGLYLPSCQEWIEFARGDIVERRRVSFPLAEVDKEHAPTMIGLALTEGNEVYASFGGRGVFRLNRSEDAWEPARPKHNEAGGTVIGIDGDMLVQARGNEISWVTMK